VLTEEDALSELVTELVTVTLVAEVSDEVLLIEEDALSVLTEEDELTELVK
jgi:hypothetical protein